LARSLTAEESTRTLAWSRAEAAAAFNWEASWVRAGRKLQLAFEVTGSKGSIFVDHERMNELQLYTTGQPHGRQGFKTILAGPDHQFFREFVPAPGHHLGFNDIKTIEVRALLTALAGGPPFQPDFREAWEIQRVVDAIVDSARERKWIEL
jgi:predicted dehydrogenase